MEGLSCTPVEDGGHAQTMTAAGCKPSFPSPSSLLKINFISSQSYMRII